MISPDTGAAPTFDELAEVVADRLARNKRIRRNLPGGGRLRIDRQLPFLCVYREPVAREDLGTRDLVTTEASYLFASAAPECHAGLAQLCRRIAAALEEHFGTFLFLEVWSADLSDDVAHGLAYDAPAFQVVTSDADMLPTTIGALQEALSKIRVYRRGARVDVVPADPGGPPDLPPLLEDCRRRTECVQLGVAVHPVYRDRQTGRLYPVVLQRLRRQLASALRKGFAAFAGSREDSLRHYHALGPTALVRAAREVDEQLCEIADAFDFVYQATPVNSEAAWQKFAAERYERPPAFSYRPLPYDTNLLKRKLFNIPIERIEDPTIGHLFAEKQTELDRQLTALADIETRNFLYGSIQIYGRPDAPLVQSATRLLAGGTEERDSRSGSHGARDPVHADDVAEAARAEIAGYRRLFADFQAVVEICDDIASGIMVSGERLLIARSVVVDRSRLHALLHHEIGTHLLTYFNGRAQPFRLLYAGLAGYEPLQEGLAVLSEYLAGGLTARRLRQLAGRVIAVDAVCSGAEFVETFRKLHREHGFSARSAFRTALRVHRAGGLTKDMVYLQGIHELLRHLERNHELEPLFVGKIGLAHVPFIQELRRRDVVRPPAVLPRLLESKPGRRRLSECRGLTVNDLLGVES